MHALDQNLYDVLTFAALALVGAYTLILLVRLLRRVRPDLAITRALIGAFAIRVLASAALSLTSFGSTVRGPDEPGEILRTRGLAVQSLGSWDFTHALTHDSYRWIYALLLRPIDSAPDLALRLIPITVACIGLALLATAVYELAGPRAAVIAAWLLAFEPTNVFFSSVIHKEPTMLLADGLVVFGAAVLWRRGRASALALMVAGCLIALSTRPYAAWFLIGASGLVVLHAWLRLLSARTFGLALTAVLLAGLAAPTVWYGTTPARLKKLQASQEFGSRDNSNLKLEPVDFSSRLAVITNVPKRIRDVLLRPYPWQTANASQRLGFLGTVMALLAFVFLIQAMTRNRGSVMERAGPLLYVGTALLIAYSISASNAGTAFRYRTHVIALVLCALVALRTRPAADSAAPRPTREPEGASLALAR